MNNKSIQQKGLSLPSRVSSKSRQETAVDKKDRPRLLLFGCRATKEAADEELCRMRLTGTTALKLKYLTPSYFVRTNHFFWTNLDQVNNH